MKPKHSPLSDENLWMVKEALSSEGVKNLESTVKMYAQAMEAIDVFMMIRFIEFSQEETSPVLTVINDSLVQIANRCTVLHEKLNEVKDDN